MNPTRTCPKCAALLPADAPQCLLALALTADPGVATHATLEQVTLDSDATRLGVPPSDGSGGGPAKARTPNLAPALPITAGDKIRFFDGNLDPRTVELLTKLRV